jgi:hypothetical protein
MKRLIVIMALGIIGSCSAVHLMPARRRSEAFSRCMTGDLCYAPFCVHKVAERVLQQKAWQEEAVRIERFKQRSEVIRPSVSGVFRRGSSLDFAKLQRAQEVARGSGSISRTGWSDVGDYFSSELQKGLMGEALERVAGRVCLGMGGAAARALLLKTSAKR